LSLDFAAAPLLSRQGHCISSARRYATLMPQERRAAGRVKFDLPHFRRLMSSIIFRISLPPGTYQLVIDCFQLELAFPLIFADFLAFSADS